MDQRGLTTIYALLVCALITSSAVFCLKTAHELLLLSAREVQAIGVKQRADAGVLNQALTPLRPRPGWTCSNFTNSSGALKITREFCLLAQPQNSFTLSAAILEGANLPKASRFPLFDFNSLFQNAETCGDRLKLAAFNLSSGSVRSSRSCANLPSVLNRSAAYSGNIAVDKLKIQAASGFTTLSATGFVAFRKSLQIQSSAILAAGGDVLIGTLELPPDVELTIVSGGGNIQLDNISGGSKLRLFAAGKVLIKNGAALGNDSALPLAEDVTAFLK